MSLTAFHADGVLMDNKTKTRHVPAVGRDAEVVMTKLRGGAFGESLTTMLRQARQFVIEPAGRVPDPEVRQTHQLDAYCRILCAETRRRHLGRQGQSEHEKVV